MPSPLLVKSTEDRVLLRAEPITESIPLALLEKGERLIVLDDVDTAKACIGEQGEWIKVQTTEGKNGYVAAWLVVQAPLGDLVVYPTVPLNVRAGPSTGTITLTTVFTHTGDGLMVLGDADIAREKIGREGRWLYVQAPSGEIGYVAAWYVYLGSLELDLWSLHARCDGRFWHQIIYIRGRMGDGVYTYYWNGQQLATLKNEGYEFEIPSSGEVISGTGSVVSGDGQRVERRLFIRRPECRGQP